VGVGKPAETPVNYYKLLFEKECQHLTESAGYNHHLQKVMVPLNALPIIPHVFPM
jgi:hypothetical protein